MKWIGNFWVCWVAYQLLELGLRVDLGWFLVWWSKKGWFLGLWVDEHARMNNGWFLGLLGKFRYGFAATPVVDNFWETEIEFASIWAELFSSFFFSMNTQVGWWFLGLMGSVFEWGLNVCECLLWVFEWVMWMIFWWFSGFDFLGYVDDFLGLICWWCSGFARTVEEFLGYVWTVGC